MRAILLAAGRGRRLESGAPKCLLSIAGTSLLERHLRCLAEAGVAAVTIVVGYERHRIADALPGIAAGVSVELVDNAQFTRGSILSLQIAADRLVAGGIWMDADVLYPAALLRRLVESAHENCVLLDGRAEESGEEMMLGTRAGRVETIARRVGSGWDVAGESVGFFKVGQAGGAVMKRILDEEIAAGRVDQEYEAALDRAFKEIPFGFERVDDFAWTEIDFQEDVEKAQAIARQL